LKVVVGVPQGRKRAGMDTLIEQFLTETKAVKPLANPAFDLAKYHPEQEGVGKMREKSKSNPAPKKPSQ